MFAAIPFDVIDMMKVQKDGTNCIGSKAVLLYVAMARRANFETGEFYASRKTLAGDIGLKKPDAVDGPMDELKAAGLVAVHPKWKDKGNPPTYSRVKDDRFCIPTASDYTLYRAPSTPGLRPVRNKDPLPDTLDADNVDEVLEWITAEVGDIDAHESTILGILGSYDTAEEAARVAMASAKKWGREGPGSLTPSRRSRPKDDLGGW